MLPLGSIALLVDDPGAGDLSKKHMRHGLCACGYSVMVLLNGLRSPVVARLIKQLVSC
jgi:hypothetical protein